MPYLRLKSDPTGDHDRAALCLFDRPMASDFRALGRFICFAVHLAVVKPSTSSKSDGARIISLQTVLQDLLALSTTFMNLSLSFAFELFFTSSFVWIREFICFSLFNRTDYTFVTPVELSSTPFDYVVRFSCFSCIYPISCVSRSTLYALLHTL